MKRLLVVAALMLSGTAANADRTYPAFAGKGVVDAANVVDAAREEAIDQKIAAYSRSSGRQIAVVTVPDLDGDTIDDYALGFGRTNGIGERDVNDGIVIAIAPKEHHAFIEVGPGLQAYLTDAKASMIVDDDMIPFFKKGDWAGGIDKGVDDVIAETSPDAITRKQEQAKADQAAHQRAMASLDTFLSWVGMILAGCGIGFGGWWLATAKKRRLRREEEDRLAAEAQAEARRRTEERAAEARAAQEEAARRRAEMLANETPAQRQKRLADEAAAAAVALAARKRAEEARAKAEAQREEDRRRRRDDDTSTITSGGFGSSFSDSTPTPTPTPTPSDTITFGGGTFDGGGGGGSW